MKKLIVALMLTACAMPAVADEVENLEIKLALAEASAERMASLPGTACTNLSERAKACAVILNDGTVMGTTLVSTPDIGPFTDAESLALCEATIPLVAGWTRGLAYVLPYANRYVLHCRLTKSK